jgi:beta-galactosidase/beta-glucuronidase
MVRKDWLCLNGLWQLGLGPRGDTLPTSDDLPEQILVPFPVESALSGVMKHADRLWYRRTFRLPESWSDKHVLLHFGAVDWEATVWLNGKKVGSHRGGYDAFTFDVTWALKPGEQELLVSVWDPTDKGTQPRGKQVERPGGIFYTPTTGIWQTVWLEPVPESHIAGLKIVPDVDNSRVRVTTRARGPIQEQIVRVVVRHGTNRVTTAEGPTGQPLDLALPNAKLWSPDHPFLYDLTVELRQGRQTIDEVQSYFGQRKIAVGKDEKGNTRVLLNGKFLFQVGPLDQGFWPDGLYTAPTDVALKYDIEVTKQLGFNMARKHVKVEPDRWYYWCDRLGLLVWQDMPSGDRSVAPGKGEITRSRESARDYDHELKRMIDGRFNHPSIIMWVIFNEGWGQFDTARIVKWTKKHDPTRLVDDASGWNDLGVGDVHDIHVYPGPGAPKPEPTRAAVLGEFGGLGLRVPGHAWSEKSWGYRGTESREDLTRKYEELLRRVHLFKDNPGLSAAVYTQTTDVETESNGLLTYDRAVIKLDPERAAAANRGTKR